ncbi:acetylcholine receptor subunit beta-like [Physella acuta]|uniref:acetylcholine receptor subunit beta-like n=1 Tax=Physella acuta TaxID=109671 RepID=UPI0027DE0179|nr:acetylcholine receptor subunit beta-like [Physella acuta]
MLPVLILTAVLTAVSSHTLTSKQLAYERLRSDLLNRSAILNQIPSGLDSAADDPYTLEVMVLLLDTPYIDDIRQMMTAAFFIELSWNEPSLTWSPPDYENLDQVYLDTASVWHPNIYTVFGDPDSLNLQLKDKLVIHSTGKVKATHQQYLTFRCAIDFLNYPFDTQTCSLAFYPDSTEPKPRFKIVELDNNYNLFKTTGEWSFVDRYSAVENITHPTPLSEFPRYYFKLKRRYFYYVMTIIFPLVLTSLMIPLVFLIPTQTREKISYLVAIFTSTAIFLNFISNVMPRGLTSQPYLATLLIEVIMEGFLATLAALGVVKMYEKEEHTYKTIKMRASSRVEAEHSSKQAEGQGQGKRHCLTSRLLDTCFLYVFFVLQVGFLVCLFCLTGWVRL